MTSTRKFYRTVIQVEVLSEDPYKPDSLGGVAEDIVVGDCSGRWQVTERQEVDGPAMADLLVAQGSDPALFGLTPLGEEHAAGA